MHFRSLLATTFCAAAFAAGCGSTPESNTNNTAANAANSNISTANTADGPLAVKTPTQAPTTNNAPTLTPIVNAYYDALKKKDDAALRKVLSDDFIKSLEADMKDENRKDLAGFMAEYDKIPEKPVEVRNETIQGNNAVAEIRGGAYINWTPFAFINEGGSWKFTGGSPAIDNVAGSK